MEVFHLRQRKSKCSRSMNSPNLRLLDGVFWSPFMGARITSSSFCACAKAMALTSRVECCSIAGSLGYNKQPYEKSMEASEVVFGQVAAAGADGPRALLARRHELHHVRQPMAGRIVPLARDGNR